jgi:hypothetical protein
MNIVEMFQAIGPENTCLQALNSSLTNITARNKHRDCLVTFSTREITLNDVAIDSGKVGLVVWVERGAWNRFIERSKGD